MKKTTLGLLMVLLGVYTASARQINSDEAMSVASYFMSSSGLKSSMATNSALRPMKAPGLDANASVSPYYIFNRGENEGFVIISGDDRAPKILGYSENGSFNAENLPPQLKAMMEQWATQMSKLPESAPHHASWNKTVGTRGGEGILMETAEWGQGYPFNAYCPVIEGVQSPAGCVATALAIAMKYHNWPDYARGGIQENFNNSNQPFDFSDYKIDWNVLDDINDSHFADEVGKLMLSLGVAAQMYYGPYESSAEMWPLGHKMIELYSYAKGSQYIEKSKFGEDEWYGMLLEQLNEVGPVVYRGNGEIGHAFVIDGYDGDSLFHVNWGWDGFLNGYYSLDFSDVGGSSFAENQGMIINMVPDKERKEYSKSFVPNCDVYFSSILGGGGWNFMKSELTPGEKIAFKAPDLTLNRHVGYYDIAIVDEDDNILHLLGMGHHNNDPGRHCDYPGMTLEYSLEFPELKAGQRFQLVSMEAELAEDGIGFAVPRSEDPKDWRLILGGIVYTSYFYDKNNRSDVSEVRFHVEDQMPCYFSVNNTFDQNLTIYKLKGGDCPDNIVVPKKGVSLEVECYDKDGTPKEALYVGEDDEYSDNIMWLNVSMYADKFDVYIKYEFDGDTRKDAGLSPDQIIEKDGLVYKIEEDVLVLIGYEHPDDKVTIPESIETGDKELPVRLIGDEALMFAPIKHMNIESKELRFGQLSFAGMDNLETLSVRNILAYPSVYEHVCFGKTGLKTVFLDEVPDDFRLFEVVTGMHYYLDRLALAVEDVDFVLTCIPESNKSDCFSAITNFNYCAPPDVMSSAIGSYLIPGIGEADLKQYTDLLTFNISQMWTYEIDKRRKAVKVCDVIDKVKIESVFINGNEASLLSDSVYEVVENSRMEENENNGIDVVVNYFVDGLKKTTHYTPKYNETVESTDLSGVETTFIDSDIIDVYGLDGMLVKKNADREGLKTLTPGIYLIRQGGEVKKLIIR